MYFLLEILALALVFVAGSETRLKNDNENGRILKIVTTGSDRNLKNVTTGNGHDRRIENTESDQYIHSVLGTKIIVRPGRHVCTAEKVISRPVKVTQTYKKPIYTNHPRDCADFNNCPQFDVRYEEKNRTVFLLQKSSSFRHSCCPGWTKGSKRTKGCMAPICTSGCGDFGVCVKPETCQCPRGFEGEMCDTDIDECRNTEHGCQQMCKNTAGSYMCACHTGFTLAEDGKTCVYCYPCQKEYTDMVLSVENVKKQLSESISLQSQHTQLLKTEENVLTNRIKSLEENIRNLTDKNTEQELLNKSEENALTERLNTLEEAIRDLTDRNSRLEEDMIEIREKYEKANQEIERLQNLSMATQAPPIIQMPSQSTTTRPTTTESTTTATTSSQGGNYGGGLQFSTDDMLYSLSNQIGMMEEKLELCNCHARRRP
ncbi:epidermal growth factor-like protein 7 [Ruditapes philippinarum]|uniref:epidermal growth factor-like protein 7 n=1 Tax=Ruditapes philippinarum TaxID=129788 RepID=UPI00295B5EFE|nr:epidermal growth factor-like protein 7 [Ruditapes philippinarum]